MEHVVARLNAKDIIVAGVISLAVVAGLPVLGILVFALRPVLIVAVLAAIPTACLLWVFSGRFRQWLAAETELEVNYRGLRMPQDLALHPSHSWARMYDVVVVGADDLVQAALGPVEEVELPPNGRHVRRGDELFRLRHADRCLEVRAPVSGTVIAANETLRHHPELINQEPFGQGWVVRLRADDLQEDRPALLRGGRARVWFRREVDRLLEAMSTKGGATAASPEGPVPAAQLHRQIDDSAWNRLTATTFTAQRTEPEDAR